MGAFPSLPRLDEKRHRGLSKLSHVFGLVTASRWLDCSAPLVTLTDSPKCFLYSEGSSNEVSIGGGLLNKILMIF
jgi:hypothetical protein